MRELGGDMVIAVWELAREQHPLDRALTLLGLAHPTRSRDELARMPLGVRDRELLVLRERLFGPTLELQAHCPACAESSEFEVAIRDLVCPPSSGEPSLATEHGPVRFRLPDSRDLASALACRDPALARRAIAERCVLDDVEIDDSLIASLERAIEGFDPQAEVRFALTCAACSHAWKPVLDIGELLFAELSRVARDLLGQVHVLAHAYKWRESEILAMSATRRRMYLQMVGYE